MTSLAYLHDCHSCYNERSIVQKKNHSGNPSRKLIFTGELTGPSGHSSRSGRVEIHKNLEHAVQAWRAERALLPHSYCSQRLSLPCSEGQGRETVTS